MKPRSFTDEQEAEIAGQYATPLPDGTWTGAQTLASRWGCSVPTIYNLLRRQGVATRDIRESHAHGKRCKPIKNLPPAGEPVPNCRCGCGLTVAWNRRQNGWNVYVAGHYRRDAPYKHVEWLRGEYVDKRRTVSEIASECGVNVAIVIRFMERFGIPRRDKSQSRRGRHVGPANASWRGGTTPERQRVYRSGDWKDVVRAVYARDNYTCRRCGSPKPGPRGLHAHHIRAWATDPALRVDPDNLVTLCRDCHTWVHSRENVDRDWLG